MPRIIDADKLKAHYAWWNNEQKKLFDQIVDLQPTVDIPTVDAEPVRHGHIVYRERHRINYGKYTGFDENGEEHTITVCEDYGSGKEPYCSECGSQLAESFLNYCPNCGARMDEEEE